MPKRKPRKIEFGKREWNIRLKSYYDLYINDTIEQCIKCGSPKHEMYICWFCGDDKSGYKLDTMSL